MSESKSDDRDFETEVRQFSQFGRETLQTSITFERADGTTVDLPCYSNEFWTSKQRQAHALHEISYRACFKPQLPAFFIERLTSPGDTVFDPFMGRGTTLLEAALRGRIPFGCDINPLSQYLLRPRLSPPTLESIRKRLDELDWTHAGELPEDLLVFYHSETLKSVCALRAYLLRREASGAIDEVDEWIRLVAINRLTGHSSGFFSVYSMPPNQAVSVQSQQRINARRNQCPVPKDVAGIILKKSRSLLRNLTSQDLSCLRQVTAGARFAVSSASQAREVPDASVSLVVTSPPFLNVVNYAADNWLRCWFIGIEAGSLQLTVPGKLSEWEAIMVQVFMELVRVLKPGGHVAFEVGEVRKGSVNLEESVLRCADQAGLRPLMCMVQAQDFTKTAHCWGVDNNAKGTNSHRIVVLVKECVSG